MKELEGLGVAMVTPFNSKGKVDFTALERLVKHLHTGADYLVVMGTTGESVTLDWEEQMAILNYIREINNHKLPMVFGLGGNDTKALISKLKSLDTKGLTAILSVSPAYSKPSQKGILEHYQMLSKQSPLPILLYNVPGRTGTNMLPATVFEIANACPKVIGIKEAGGSMAQVMELIRFLPQDFLHISGDDHLIVPHMACGGHGLISVIGNAFPKDYGQVLALTKAGEYEKARNIHYSYLPMIESLFAEGNPGGIKEVLKHLGICDHFMRLPLFPVSEELSSKLYRQIAELT